MSSGGIDPGGHDVDLGPAGEQGGGDGDESGAHRHDCKRFSITGAKGLRGETARADPEKAVQPCERAHDDGAECYSTKVMRFRQTTHNGRIHHSKQRRGGIGEDQRQGEPEGLAIGNHETVRPA